MQTDREKRYSSAKDMKADVEKLFAYQQRRAGASSSSTPEAPRARSNRKMILGGLGAAAMLGVGAFFFFGAPKSRLAATASFDTVNPEPAIS